MWTVVPQGEWLTRSAAAEDNFLTQNFLLHELASFQLGAVHCVVPEVAKKEGRVQWSACTKLNVSFNETTMRRLAGDGLRTLEIGLETLEQGAQKLIHKEQSIGLFRSFLDAATAAQVAIVINYMTGLPGADPAEEAKWLEVVRAEVRQRPELNARVEHNTFQLEHLSPMGREPEKYGLEVVAEWPWSSLLEFRVRGFDHAQTA
jgi:hypothetical protein